MNDKEMVGALGDTLGDIFQKAIDENVEPAQDAVARECLRQMKWAWYTGDLEGNDSAMSCGYSRERLVEDYEPWRIKDADIHLAPKDWKP